MIFLSRELIDDIPPGGIRGIIAAMEANKARRAAMTEAEREAEDRRLRMVEIEQEIDSLQAELDELKGKQ